MSLESQAAALNLNESEKAELRGLLHRSGTSQALAYRIRIILACAEPGATNVGVAAALGVTRQTVAHWRRRFAERKVDGLVDAPRSGAPRSISEAAVERLIALTLEEAPSNSTQWSTRAMARRSGMSQTAVSRYWRANGLRPHQADTFKLSSDPASIEKVLAVLTDEFATPASIGRAACLPTRERNVTVARICEALEGRGLVERGGTKQHPKWRRADANEPAKAV